MARFSVLPAALVAIVLAAVPAGAETYRFVAPDGTVHLTNAPTDPRYQRLGFTSGTAQEWLRLPGPDLAPYAREILEAAERYGVPERLISAVIRTESAFNPVAVSRKGAQGLMQLMPGTAGRYAVGNAFDPASNIRGGVRYLRFLHDMFSGRLPLALAAYNAGENVVLRYNGVPPYPETRQYVNRVLGFYGRREPVAIRTGAGPSPRRVRTDVAQFVASTPSVFRRVDADGTPLYTNLPPLVQSPPGSTR